MRAQSPLWVWYLLAGACLVAGGALLLLYSTLPVDGAAGDLTSVRPHGFQVRWVLEAREPGLRTGDLILSAGGHTLTEWLAGAEPDAVWRSGDTVSYKVWRQGQTLTLPLRLAPIPFRAVLSRWRLQFVVALAFLLVGLFVAWKRPYDLAARLLMLFCVAMALQFVGDAYNVQYATFPRRWPFWFHFAYEHTIYGISLATAAWFALVFPTVHPLIERAPRLLPASLYVAFPLAIGLVSVLAPDLSTALRAGSQASWAVALAELALTFAAGIRSSRVAQDPVARAQIRWIVWCGAVGCAILIPGYVLPMMLTGSPIVPHPTTMLLTALIPATLAVAILRYRLFDIEIVIHRTLVYATLTALLAGLYFLVVWILSFPASLLGPDENRSLVIFLATLIIALAFDPLRRRVQRVIALAFYRDRPDYQRLVADVSERLATRLVLDDVARLLSEEIPHRLQITSASLAVLDLEEAFFVPAGNGQTGTSLPVQHPLPAFLQRSGQALLRLQPPAHLPLAALAFLERQDIEVSIPLIVGGKTVGLYNLGPKRSGDAYVGEEIQLLHILGRQSAVAVENSRLYEQARQEITERRRAEEQLKASLTEKEILLKEIHHRVKNNLQVISSLLYLQSKGSDDTRVLALLSESRHRLRSMALIHEQLYQTEHLDRVLAPRYLRALTSYLFRSYGDRSGRVRLQLEAEDLWLSIDVAVPCGLLVNELLSNALKHAFPAGQEGEALVELKTSGPNDYRLVVADNGVGLPQDLDLHHASTLGLQLVHMLVGQLGGILHVGNECGSRFEITFPVSPKEGGQIR